MSSIDLVKQWGADHIVDAMRGDSDFALAVFSAIANATDIASAAAKFGHKAKASGCVVAELDGLPSRLRRLADILET